MPIRKELSLDYALSTLPIGSLVFLSDFSDYDTAFTCRALARKCKDGEFARIAQGIYAKPNITKFGPLYPSVHEVVKAIARRDNAKVLPTGETALNQLGLSTQVPLRMVYLTSGSARDIEVNGTNVKLKRSVPKTFAFKSDFLSLLHQALKALGKENVTEQELDKIKTLIAMHPETEAMEHDLKLMPVWMRKLIKDLKGL